MDRTNAAMWDERYGGADYAYGLQPNAFLASRTQDRVEGLRAIVPGDGEGRNGVWLAGQGYVVDTLDLSEHGVAKAKRLAASRGLQVNALCEDALAWPWPSSHYDLVALIYVHLVAPQRQRLHALALAALRPGGRIVLEAFRPEQIARQQAGVRGGPRDAALLYRLEDLRADFAGAEIEEIGEYEVNLSEGALHVGASAVVRMVARAR
jgi:SAM-dependent methyltransferase